MLSFGFERMQDQFLCQVDVHPGKCSKYVFNASGHTIAVCKVNSCCWNPSEHAFALHKLSTCYTECVGKSIVQGSVCWLKAEPHIMNMADAWYYFVFIFCGFWMPRSLKKTCRHISGGFVVHPPLSPCAFTPELSRNVCPCVPSIKVWKIDSVCDYIYKYTQISLLNSLAKQLYPEVYIILELENCFS